MKAHGAATSATTRTSSSVASSRVTMHRQQQQQPQPQGQQQHARRTFASTARSVNGGSDVAAARHRQETLKTRQSSAAPSPSESALAVGNGAPTATLQGIEGLIARIPSPPGMEDDQLTQSAMLVKQYYILLQKCHDWHRYAQNMKAKADHLEIENRYLRETSRKHEEDVRALERQLGGLKETAMLLDEERRREGRAGMYGAPPPPPSLEQGATRQLTLRHPSSQRVRRPSDLVELASSNGIPSPPSAYMDSQPFSADGRSSAAGFVGLNTGHYSSLDFFDAESEPAKSGRLPNSLLSFSPVHGAEPTLHGAPEATAAQQMRIHAAHHYLHTQAHLQAHIQSKAGVVPGHMRNDSNIAELLAQDAANREAAAMHEHVTRQQQQQLRTRAGIVESRSFPPSDNTHSAALTTQVLAGQSRENKPALAMNRLPSSSSAPMLRPVAAKQQSPPGGAVEHALRHQISEGSAIVSKGKHRAIESSSDDKSLRGLGLQEGDIVKLQQDELGVPCRAPTRKDGGHLTALTESRSVSSHSDAMTVTGDYLQSVVEQKRQLRKISQSQQQQLQYLQARVQMMRPSSSAENVNGSNAENVAPPNESRPSSRMSNHGVRSKVRSRAGSYSVHDAIPVDKDDVFSSQQENEHVRTVKRSGSAPLGQITLNGRSGAVSAMELRHYAAAADEPSGTSDLSAAGTEEGRSSSRLQTLESVEDGQSSCAHSRTSSHDDMANGERATATTTATMTAGHMLDNDPKGAHRRLYIRLREELSTPELQRFERYVHKYDALLIEMEGPKGIINRVRRLLLPETIVRAKQTHRARYQFRKELAREFERIVRDDAVPSSSEGNTQSALSVSEHSGMAAVAAAAGAAAAAANSYAVGDGSPVGVLSDL